MSNQLARPIGAQRFQPPDFARYRAARIGNLSFAVRVNFGPIPESVPDYAAIVATLLARYDVRVIRWRPRMSGCAWATFHADGTSDNFIEAPLPKTPISLAIFLHEIGHHAIGFFTYRKRCEEEYHAWLWALNTMREFGIEPDARTQRRFDHSMRYAVDKAVRRGVLALPEALHAFLPAA